jgi:hypothetical protein
MNHNFKFGMFIFFVTILGQPGVSFAQSSCSEVFDENGAFNQMRRSYRIAQDKEIQKLKDLSLKPEMLNENNLQVTLTLANDIPFSHPHVLDVKKQIPDLNITYVTQSSGKLLFSIMNETQLKKIAQISFQKRDFFRLEFSLTPKNRDTSNQSTGTYLKTTVTKFFENEHSKPNFKQKLFSFLFGIVGPRLDPSEKEILRDVVESYAQSTSPADLLKIFASYSLERLQLRQARVGESVQSISDWNSNYLITFENGSSAFLKPPSYENRKTAFQKSSFSFSKSDNLESHYVAGKSIDTISLQYDGPTPDFGVSPNGSALTINPATGRAGFLNLSLIGGSFMDPQPFSVGSSASLMRETQGANPGHALTQEYLYKDLKIVSIKKVELQEFTLEQNIEIYNRFEQWPN